MLRSRYAFPSLAGSAGASNKTCMRCRHEATVDLNRRTGKRKGVWRRKSAPC